VREIQEERLLRLEDEPARAFRVRGRQGVLVGRRADLARHAVTVEQGQRRRAAPPGGGVRHGFSVEADRPHVVRVRQPEELVEPVLERQVRLVIAEVPLPHQRGAVAGRAQQFRQRFLRFRQAVLVAREQRPGDADAIRVPAGQQRGP
jgi:hypothetical protein